LKEDLMKRRKNHAAIQKLFQTGKTTALSLNIIVRPNKKNRVKGK
jgi:hypothetical protein